MKRQYTTNFLRYLTAAGVVAAALGSSAAMAQPGLSNAIVVPQVPGNLKVADGNSVFLSGHAQGTQNYICLPSTSGFAWTFFSPQATLFFTLNFFGTEIHQQIITHFLSPNPAEGGTGRATWQSSLDTSAVWGKTSQSSTDSSFVAPGAIPWLTLEAVGTQAGPGGGDILAHTTFIQRLKTSGGVAPATGCSEAANVGATALIPYSADYFFYKKDGKN